MLSIAAILPSLPILLSSAIMQAEPASGVTPADAHVQRITGRYEEAIKSYTSLLESGTDRLAAACGLARCYLEVGRYDDARTVLRSVEDDGRGQSLWLRTFAEVLVATGQYQEAIDLARRAVDADENDLQARYLLGQLYETVGRRDEAIKVYQFFEKLVLKQLPAKASNLMAAGQGFLRYSVLTRHPNLSTRTVHTLQEMLQPAYEFVDRTYWPARIAAADLLRSKSRHDQAAEDYEAALAINKNLAAAHVGLGRIALADWDFEVADRRVALAKACNPNSVAALQLEADLHVTERRYEQAKTAAERALEINSNDVESLGLAAAASYALNDSQAVERYRARAYAVTPTPSVSHRVVGDTMSALRQYPDAERQFQQAIEADPTDPHPRTELGLMYMQWGDEPKAHEALAAAWQLDEFDARTFNTLDLLEKLEAFARHETEHFIIRYDAAKDAILPRCYADYLEEIYEEVCEDYDWRPAEKTIVEFLPTHRMFAVRITGKPWIHTVGACTGRVIALDSPRTDAQLRGPYHVAHVLRHEFAHTVTLAATNNRIPHWFTEGLAVLQEDRPRSFDWTLLLADAIRRGELFTLTSIDWGFMRPRRPTDQTLAYAQSEWMCAYIIKRFGYETINRLIEQFRQGRPQTEVFPEILGIDPSTFDQNFAAWARQEAQNWGLPLDPPEDVVQLRALSAADQQNVELLSRLARAELVAGNVDQALTAARAGLAIDGQNELLLVTFGQALLSVREHTSDPKNRASIDAELAPAMKRLADVAPDQWVAAKALALIALERREYDEALAQFQRLKRLRPLDPAGDQGLADVHLERQEYDQALPHLLELTSREEPTAEVAASIAMIHARNDSLAEARFWYRQAAFIDPFNVAIHEDFAAVLMRMGATREAAAEYETLGMLEPQKPEHFERAALAYHKLGDAHAARRMAEQAVKLNPDSPARSLLNDPTR